MNNFQKAKIFKKLTKFEKLIDDQYENCTTREESNCIFLSNVGVTCGGNHDLIQTVLTQRGLQWNRIVLPLDKPFAFVEYRDKATAVRAFEELNGKPFLSSSSQSTYIGFLKCVPPVRCPNIVMPPGLRLIQDVLSIEEEIEWLSHLNLSQPTGSMSFIFIV